MKNLKIIAKDLKMDKTHEKIYHESVEFLQLLTRPFIRG